MESAKNIQECFVILFDLISDEIFSIEDNIFLNKPFNKWKNQQFEAFAKELNSYIKDKHLKIPASKSYDLFLGEPNSRTRWKKFYNNGSGILNLDHARISERLNFYCSFLHNKNSEIPNNWITFVQDYCQLPYYHINNKVISQIPDKQYEPQELAVKRNYSGLFKLRKSVGDLLYRGKTLNTEHLLTFELLIKSKKTALIGPSGVGKSAFIRKCCSDWANSKHQDSAFIPLYVDLRDKAFEGDLKEYLANQYFSHLNPVAINDFLDSKDQYLLLLDSFDMLSSDQQRKLMEYMSISYERYLVLSQPTDLVPFEQHFNEVYELIGLGETGIDMFITNQFTGKAEEEVGDFLKIIEDNHTLNNLKKRPRHLRQMIDIFKASFDRDALRKVKSSAGLARLHSRLKEVQ